ncbi:hypothetical protein SHM7688_00251 [Shimia marina]|uniref:Uncharacterized protein n=1 Tax=Shimia marina TaxID=321267 RepID=A0A0P1F8T4_9RHOB|nr:hypothetical protein SHM7688_00251 [Shimia marina]
MFRDSAISFYGFLEGGDFAGRLVRFSVMGFS